LRLLIVLLCCCGPRLVHDQAVTITCKPVMPSCYLQGLPEPPKLLELNFEDEDIWRRTSVHYLTGNEIIQYEQELATWAQQVRECFLMMQGGQ
jgi:hypothetical protein